MGVLTVPSGCPHYEGTVAAVKRSNSKTFKDRVREVFDALVDEAESLLSPPPAPVPIRVRPRPVPVRRRR